jgi:hypothetical protein
MNYGSKQPLRGAARHLLGEDALIERWPHLLCAGPQPANQLAEYQERQVRTARRNGGLARACNLLKVHGLGRWATVLSAAARQGGLS